MAVLSQQLIGLGPGKPIRYLDLQTCNYSILLVGGWLVKNVCAFHKGILVKKVCFSPTAS